MDEIMNVENGAAVLPDLQPENRVSRKVLAWCFGIPFAAMLLLYICLRAWPFGDYSVLVLDLNAQYVYFFEKLRSILLEGDSILYAFERNLGGEFMGMFAYYLSSPFSLLVALFPKNMITEAIFAILLLKCGTCGLTFGYFLEKTRKLKPTVTVMFSVMYALSAYAVVMQHNLMWTDNLISLPLLILGMDALIKEGKYKMYVLSLVYCIMSNFYIGFMSCILVFLWFFIRYFMMSEAERNPLGKSSHFIRTLVRIGLFSLIAVAISAVILLPVVHSLSFGKNDFSDPPKNWKQMYDFLDLLTKTFFGSYDTVRPEGMPFIYCGMLMPVLAPLYFFNSHFPKRQKLGYMLILLVFIVSFNLNQADILWHGGQKPNWLNARFAYMFVFFALVLTADALSHLREAGVKKAAFSAGCWAVILLIMQKLEYDHLPDFLGVWASLGFLAIYAALVPWALDSKRYGQTALSVVVCCEMVLNGGAMIYNLDKDVVFTKRDSYRSWVDKYAAAVDTIEDDTFYRAEKLNHRKKNDNFAVNLNGLSNSTSTLNERVVTLLKQFGYTSKSHWSMYIGANPVTDALFGIKYVIADENAKKGVMDYIHNLYELKTTTADALDIYQNPYALSIAYEVSSEILDYDLPPREDPEKPGKMIDEEYICPFDYMNRTLSAMIGEEIQVFTEQDRVSQSASGVKRLNVVDHTGYEKQESPAKLTWKMNVESTDPLYLYFSSDYPRKTTLKLNGKNLGTYFESETHGIMELGTFNIGDQLEIEMKLEESNLYLGDDDRYFWYFNEEAFTQAVNVLQQGGLEAYSDTDDEIYGTIRVQSDESVIFTTIPHDEGWKVLVDGEPCETTAVLNGTLLAFDCPAGDHEIRMIYRPDSVTWGLTISIAGLAAFAAVWITDEFLKRRRAEQKPVYVPQETEE